MSDGDGVSILHVVASRQRRGAEMFVSDLVRELAAAGVTQRVVALRDHDGEVVSFDAPTSVLGTRPRGPLRIDLRAILRLRAVIRSEGSCVVQAHGGEALKYAVPAALGSGSVLAYRRIGASLPGRARGIQMAGHRRIVRRAHVVVAVSEATRLEMVHSFGVRAKRVIRIPNGIDVQRALPRRPRAEVRRGLGVDDASEVVVSVGALNWEKDPFAQIEVFERVVQARPRAVLLMVGSGPLERDARRAVIEKGLEDRIGLLGTRNDVAEILGASDVLLLASRTEGMPGVVIEAGIAQLPVAGYALSGVPEVVIDQSTGLLAPPGDIDRIAACVIDLLSDADLRLRLGRAAHERCTTEFAIQSVAAAYLDLYRRLWNDARSVRLEPAR